MKAFVLFRIAWALVFFGGLLLLDETEQIVGEWIGTARAWAGRSLGSRFPSGWGLPLWGSP
jgi:hypothetical protein